MSGITAYQAVRALGLEPGQTLLVNNPVGFVGRLAVQIAKARGARVLATAAPRHAQLAAQIGADHVITDNRPARDVHALTDSGADAALDLVGGATARATFDSVRDDGRYATVIPAWWIDGGQYETSRGITPRVVENRPNRSDLTALASLAAAGRLRFDIAATHRLDELTSAHDALSRSGVLGKIIVQH